MHVGMAAVFQNTGRALSDRQIYLNELALADMAEPLGFESIWSVEHHFTDYTMCPDVVQFLSYMAGRTKHVRLGSMVVVLPWHDPMRVAEQISMLDHLSGGRMILGLGRGAGKVEFDGFRLDMGDSRELFVEYGEALLKGLESGVMEHQGKHYRQPPVEIRPAPFKSFRGRTYAAAVSPESARIMARLGVGLLIIPQKPWREVEKELAEYNALYREINGSDAPQPISAGWTFVDESAERAREMAVKYIGGYYRTVLDHYQFAGAHMKNQRGYEYYAKMNEKLAVYGDQKAIEFFADLQVYGTPEQVHDKIMAIHRQTNNCGYVGVFSYAGMPHEEAARNMAMFARTVMPELKKFDAGAPIDRSGPLPDLRFAAAAAE
jgi:alkanesulfonate monooxygenase SsuD/methylene tetrahydromethanopterin reductase-like flavin-dependent oxidoreductase (luciferase family)